MNCMQFVASILMDTNLSQEMNLQSLSKVFSSKYIKPPEMFFKMWNYNYCQIFVFFILIFVSPIFFVKCMFIEIYHYFYFRWFVRKWPLPRKRGHGWLSSESRVLDWRWNGKCTTRSRKSDWTYSTLFGSWRTTTALWIEVMKFGWQWRRHVVKYNISRLCKFKCFQWTFKSR